MGLFIELLRDPLINRMDNDSVDRFLLHGKILKRKRMLREVFEEFHHLFYGFRKRFLVSTGVSIELGSGVAPMRDSYPDVIATDIVSGPGIDRVLNAESMDLESNTVSVFIGQNCFHHFPSPERFFSEIDRVLCLGGGVILLEPYYGPVARWVYKRLFRTEGFDPVFPSWETPSTGPMNGANQALSYIVFVRDRKEFERRHPSLKIVHQEFCGNYLRYLFSGGLNFRQMFPERFVFVLRFVEWFLSPFNRWLALHHVIVLRKESVPIPMSSNFP